MSNLCPLPSCLQSLSALRVSIPASLGDAYVVEVTLSRPQKLNALGLSFWREFPLCMQTLDHWSPCRCVLLTADGPAFCSGIDLNFASEFFLKGTPLGAPLGTPERASEGAFKEVPKGSSSSSCCTARRAFYVQEGVERLQAAVSSLEQIRKPVVVAVSGPCLGAGVDIICCCDIRMCAADALFSCKEIDLAMAPDLGTLQRLPLIVRSSSWAREVIYTGRSFGAAEAEQEGLVSSIHADRDTLRKAALSLCLSISSKSPVALAAAKIALNYSRGRPVEAGLLQQQMSNAAMLQTDDIPLALQQQIQRKKKSKREKMSPFAGL